MTKETNDRMKVLDDTLASIDKELGKGLVHRGNQTAEDISTVKWWNLSSPVLSKLMGKGLPRRRVIEIFGPEGCLAKDTFIPYEITTSKGKRNHRGGSIKKLYERFHDLPLEEREVKQGVHFEDNEGQFFVKSVDDEGCVFSNPILDVVKTGVKNCYEVETSDGQLIQCTEDHKFMTNIGFLPLSDISIGDSVYIHNNTRFTCEKKGSLKRPERMVKYHPFFPKKISNGYTYHGSYTSRFAYEAYLNSMTLEEYISFLNTKSKEEIDSLTFLSPNIQIHHKDENFLNNEIDNLEAMTCSEHSRLHAKERKQNLSFIVVLSSITRIDFVGERETYDIKCLYPYNNYIANGIVVHNSGKSTIAQIIAADIQKQGGIVAYIDVENALDYVYAQELGMNVTDENFILSQPDSAEHGLEIAKKFAASGAVDLIVIDSVAALVPKAEIEGDMGDSHMGLQARLMSQALRKLTAANKGSTIIFINQIRMKIGVMFGNPETTSGGRALRFYSSIRLDIRRVETLTEGDDAYGQRVRIKVVKNKVGMPFGKSETDLIYGVGLDQYKEYLDFAVLYGVVNKAGSWYSYKDHRIGQGAKNASTFLKENPDMFEEVKKLVDQQLFPSPPKEEKEVEDKTTPKKSSGKRTATKKS